MNLLQKVKNTFSQHSNGHEKGNVQSEPNRGNDFYYQQLLEGLPAAFYTCDANGHILLFNKAAVELWGREPEIGKDMWCGSWKIYQPDGITPLPPDQCPMAIALKEGRSVIGEEIVIERPDGLRRHVQPNPVPIFDSQGNVTGAVNMLVDITDRIISEQKASTLAAIVESSSDAIISKTLNGIVTSWNKTAEKLFGYKADEMIGQPITRLIPPDRLNEETSILERLKKGEVVDHFETKRVTKNKEVRDISLTISPIKDSKGRIVGASKIARDITEKKETEQNLQKSEERLRMAGQSAKLGVWEYHPLTKKLIWSDECRMMYNIPAGIPPTNEFVASHLYPSDKEYVDGEIAKAIDPENAKSFNIVHRILRDGDHQLRWLRVQGKTYFDEKGHPEKVVGIMVDITEEKEVEQDQQRFREKIRERDLLFKTISNVSPVGLWMTDIQGQNIFVNDTWIQWTGVPYEKQLGSGWMQGVEEPEKSNAVAAFMDCLQRREKYTTEFRLRDSNDEVRWCLTEGSPYYDINGEFLGYAGSVTDITEIRKLEQRKDDFIKMASHELKTPITSIKGYVQLLLNIHNELNEEKLQASRPTVKSSLLTISKQVSKLTRLVSELLDLSRIDSGRLELNKTIFDLGDLMEETVQDVRYTTSRHAIIVHNDYEGKAMVYGDKDRIGQVFLNLLTNAIKYSPEAYSIEIRMVGDKNTVAISVRDFGIGIDKKDHQKIFERFYRVEGKSELTFPGFGIGLFIAGEIIQRHQGTITVQSEKEVGSLFTVTLPVSKNA